MIDTNVSFVNRNEPLLKALWGGQHRRPAIHDRLIVNGIRVREAGKISMPFKIGEWTKAARVCNRKIWFDAKASDPPKSHANLM